MNREEFHKDEAPEQALDGQREALPFDQREWATVTYEAQERLRRQYGREARQRADD